MDLRIASNRERVKYALWRSLLAAFNMAQEMEAIQKDLRFLRMNMFTDNDAQNDLAEQWNLQKSRWIQNPELAKQETSVVRQYEENWKNFQKAVGARTDIGAQPAPFMQAARFIKKYPYKFFFFNEAFVRRHAITPAALQMLIGDIVDLRRKYHEETDQDAFEKSRTVKRDPSVPMKSLPGAVTYPPISMELTPEEKEEHERIKKILEDKAKAREMQTTAPQVPKGVYVPTKREVKPITMDHVHEISTEISQGKLPLDRVVQKHGSVPNLDIEGLREISQKGLQKQVVPTDQIPDLADQLSTILLAYSVWKAINRVTTGYRDIGRPRSMEANSNISMLMKYNVINAYIDSIK